MVVADEAAQERSGVGLVLVGAPLLVVVLEAVGDAPHAAEVVTPRRGGVRWAYGVEHANGRRGWHGGAGASAGDRERMTTEDEPMVQTRDNERRCRGCESSVRKTCAAWCPIGGDEARLAENDPLVQVADALWLLDKAEQQGELAEGRMSDDAGRAIGRLRQLRDALLAESWMNEAAGDPFEPYCQHDSRSCS